MERPKSYYLNHLFFFALYALINFFVLIIRDSGVSNVFLVWNVFLALLPILFSRWFLQSRDRRKTETLLAGFLWGIFWPNTFYMVTDVIHFSGDTFLEIVWGIPYVTPNQVVYSTDLFLWLKVLIIVTGVLYAIMNGVHSEKDIEAVIFSRYGREVALLFRAVCAVLGGTAIYIGRFLRANSWDIFVPSKIWELFLSVGHDWQFVGGFIGLFASFILGILCFYDYFSRASH